MSDNTLPEHPLITALKDTQRVAAMNKALRGLARAQHGIQNRETWIAMRQQQIEHLNEQVALVLKAYDEADQRGMIEALREIERSVKLSEGQSPLEETLTEVLEVEEESDERSVAEVQKVFNSRRKRNDGPY